MAADVVGIHRHDVAEVFGSRGDVVDVLRAVVAKRVGLGCAAVAGQAVAQHVVDVEVIGLEMDAVTAVAPGHLDAGVVVHQLDTLHLGWLPSKTGEYCRHP